MDKSCFVIMPFSNESNEYFSQIYVPAIQDAELNPIRVDDLSTPCPILNDIWHLILNSEILLADITGLNANVMYELGLAHAAGRPVVMVTDSIESVPFDLRALRIIVYDNTRPKWDVTLQTKITQALLETLRMPLEAVLPTFLERRPEKRIEISELKSDVIEIKQMLFNQFDRLTKGFTDSPTESRSLNADEYYAAKSDAKKMYLDEGLSMEEIRHNLREKYNVSSRVASDILDKSIWY